MNKSKSLIPSYIVFGLLLGLVQCSENAMRSALYEPEAGTTGNTPAGPVASTQASQSGTSGSSSGHTLAEGPFGRGGPTGGGIPSAAVGDSESSADPDSAMTLTLTNKESLIESLWPEARSRDVRIDSVRMDLKTLKVVEELSERHLTGYLVIKSAGQKTRHLANEGSVVFAAAGETDIMQAQFRISNDLFVVIDMTRVRSRTPEEADQNPWEGSVSLLKGEKRSPVGKMKGIVTLFEGSDE
ncbi:MAG: hypothetical protein ABIR96_07465 [Bdellovibrionota bacterium]